MKTTLGALAIILASSLSACGGDDKSDTDAQAELEDTYPLCSEVWVVGNEIDDDYEGCLLDDKDTIQAGVSIDCEDGSKFFTHEEGGNFWTEDGVVATGDEDAYSAAYSACQP